VDGTLVTPEKVLTQQTTLAVEQLRGAGILFAITSGRPPRGISMFIEPLNLTTPDDLVAPTIEVLTTHGMSIWIYQGVN
jgi:hydroxymethylpyrimidine pyrophosphatase-like HAD family hydrolase